MATGSAPAPGHWSGLERRVKTERRTVTVLILLLTALLGYFSQETGIGNVDNLLYDRALQLTTKPPMDESIVLIAIDDDSIEQLGHWPWRRHTHARLLQRLVQARAVGFDVLFNDSNPAYPLDDALLAQAIAQHGRVVLPTMIREEPDETGQVIMPLPDLTNAAAGLGYINATTDSDGAIRSIVLHRELGGGRIAEHFIVALQNVAAYRGTADSLSTQTPAPDTAPPGTDRSSQTADRKRLIPYAGGTGQFPLYPYAAVLRGEIPAHIFHDRLVLIGNWSSGLGDAFATPVSEPGTPMPGVEILANGLNALIHDRWIRSTTPLQAALLSCLPILLTCLTFRRCSPRQSLLLTAAILTLVLLSSLILLQLFDIWLPPTASIIGIIVALPVWNWRSQEAALRHIDEQLGMLRQDMSPSMNVHPANIAAHDRSLPARVTELNQAISQFRRAERHREETLRFLSHDMRAPQNAILALLDMQERNPDNLEDTVLLERVRQHATTTLALTDGFVQMAKAEMGPMDQHNVDLADLVYECCDSFWELAQHKGISLRDEALPEHAWVVGDRNLLGRALRNLLDNALKYSPAGSEVSCSLTRQGADWAVAVQDQGSGLTPEQVATLFRPFHQLNGNTPDSPGGVGLGLSFVRIIAERHGGTISVQSHPGQGSTFTLSLKAANDMDALAN